MLTSKRNQILTECFVVGAEFHGHLSPGLAIGIFMVDLALELLGPCDLVDAVVETKQCLPDAVQIMTPCSYGNGWLTVKNWGKFALTLFDKKGHEGVRVYVNHDKLRDFPLVYRWYMRQGKVEDSEVVSEVMEAKRAFLSWEKVAVQLPPKEKGLVATCVFCGETYPVTGGVACLRCSGLDDYYQVIGGKSTA
jgi:formylmethanofuran dehydrogenase subunit E